MHFSIHFETDGTLTVVFVRAEELAKELVGHGVEMIEYWTQVFDSSCCELV